MLKFVSSLLVVSVLVIIAVAIRTTPPETTKEPLEENTENAFGEVLGASADLAVTSQILSYYDNGNGTFTVNYRYNIQNPNSVGVNILSGTSEFEFADHTTPTMSVTSFSSPSLSLNSGFNGTSSTNMFSGSNSIAATSFATIDTSIIVTFSNTSPGLTNFIEVSGEEAGSSSGGTTTSSTTSTSGSSTSGTSTTSGSSTTGSTSSTGGSTSTGSSSTTGPTTTSSTTAGSTTGSTAATSTTGSGTTTGSTSTGTTTSPTTGGGSTTGSGSSSIYGSAQTVFVLGIGAAPNIGTGGK